VSLFESAYLVCIFSILGEKTDPNSWDLCSEQPGSWIYILPRFLCNSDQVDSFTPFVVKDVGRRTSSVHYRFRSLLHTVSAVSIMLRGDIHRIKHLLQKENSTPNGSILHSSFWQHIRVAYRSSNSSLKCQVRTPIPPSSGQGANKAEESATVSLGQRE
jgi:hypothetical protein